MAKVRIDFTGVEEYIKCPEGQHVVKVIEAEETTAQSGNDMISMKFEVISKGDGLGATVYDNFVLTEKALWKLKGFLTIMGMKADGKVALDLEKLIGKRCIVEVTEELYEGKKRARISEYKKYDPAPAAAAKGAEPADADDDDEWEEE